MNNIFKKTAALALAGAMTFSVLSACSEQPADNTPKEVKLVELDVDKDIVYGEDVSAFLSTEKKGTVEAFVFSGYEKILSTEQFEGASTEIEVYAAKNESESIVASLFANAEELGLEFKLGTLPEDVSAELFIEKTHLIEDENWPDGLLPIKTEAVDLDKNELQNILIRFNIGKNAVAGSYEIPVVITNANGEVFEVFNVDLHVWNFTYSDDYALDTAFGLDWSDDYKKYYDFLLDQKLTPYSIPYDLLSDEADAYMSDPRVTGFQVPVNEDIYKKLKSNPEWMAKAYTYEIDEPGNKENTDKLQELYNTVKSVMPEVRFLSPFGGTNHYDLVNKIDIVEIFGAHMDIYCAKLATFRNTYLYISKNGTKGYEKIYGDMQTRLNGFIEKYGKGEIWTYVCCEPGDPYTNLFVSEEGIDHRILFWQQYLVGSTGFLYWRANYWSEVDNPWTNIQTFPVYPEAYGDGCLVYPGEDYGIDGPVGSVRLEACRDGVEDYELITMVANTLGADVAMEFVNQVTTTVTEFSRDGDNFNSVRIAMGNALEAALNN